MTGWGTTGPDAGKPVYDVAGFWARSGAAHTHIPGEGDYPPVLAPGLGDITTGLSAVGGICAALVSRGKTGKGRVVTTNLLRTGLFVNSWAMSALFARGRQSRWGPRTAGGNPLLNVYQSADGKYFWLLGAESNRHWPTTCRAMGKPEWIDGEEYKTGGDRRKKQKQLLAEMDAIFKTKDLATWGEAFDREGVWWQKVNEPQEAYDDPQAKATGAFVDVPMSQVCTYVLLHTVGF